MPSVPTEDEFNGFCIGDGRIKLTSTQMPVTLELHARRVSSILKVYHRREAILMSY